MDNNKTTVKEVLGNIWEAAKPVMTGIFITALGLGVGYYMGIKVGFSTGVDTAVNVLNEQLHGNS